MKIKTETELCEKFIAAHPRSEHLYFEVHLPGGRADIVHKEHNIISIYETKLQLNISLLEQCINRKPYANFVYAVVPQAKHGFLRTLFSDYGIGVIELRQERLSYEWRDYKELTLLKEVTHPFYNRSPEKITLYEENKKEIAGSQSSGVTPFSIMVKQIKSHLEHRGELSIGPVFEHQKYYGTLKQFKTNIYQWIRTGVIKGIIMEGGKMSRCKEVEKLPTFVQ